MNTRPTVLLASLLGVALGWPMLGACAPLAPASQPVAASTLEQGWVRSEVYFGLSKPDGSLVTDEQWEAFLANEVLPRFPDGLTILEGRGQWRGPDGQQVSEMSRILVVLHPAGAEAEGLIEELRTLYRETFDQDSVLLVRSEAAVGF